MLDRRATPDRIPIKAICASRLPVRLGFFAPFLALALSCFVVRADETTVAALTLGAGQSSTRATSLLWDNFSISVTLDLPPDEPGELFSASSIGYYRPGIAPIRYLADPEETNNKFVRFRRQVLPGITSLEWGNFQAGYGRIFTDESVITRGTNGTAWE